jgi:hypothetical protein
MKHFSLLVLTLLSLMHASAGTLVFQRGVTTSATCGPNVPASPLIAETFEGTGYSASGWTENIIGTGTINEDYTGVVLDGSQSLRVTMSGSGSVYSENTWTAGGQNEIWFHFLIRREANPSYMLVFLLRNGGSNLSFIYVTPDGELLILDGTSANSSMTSSQMAIGTTYHVFGHWKKGTGSNSQFDVGFSTDGTVPTSGSNFAGFTNGTDTLQALTVYFGIYFGADSGSYAAVFDRFYIDDAPILCNP